MGAHTQTMLSSGKKHKHSDHPPKRKISGIFMMKDCIVSCGFGIPQSFFNIRELLARKDWISLDQRRSKSSLFSVALGDTAHLD